ncbi:MAG: ABC transporter permease, partial [Minisyncoccota bacterium]
MFKNFILLALKSTRHRPLRSWLTVAGVVIGVMLVVVIFALSSGVKNLLSNMLQMFGSDLIFILPGKETDPLSSVVGGQRFKESDLNELENIPGVAFMAAADVGVLNVEYKGEKKSSMVHGIPWKPFGTIFEESQGVRLRDGTWPSRDDTREVMLGYLVADKLFKQQIRVGDEVTIKAKRMRVVGIFAPMGSQEDDNSFFISLDIFQELTGKEEGAMSAFLKIAPGADIDLVGRQVRFELSKQETVRDFSVLTPSKANQLVGNILGVIEFVLLIIALVSLIVGAVGIMNTMYTS